MFTNCKISKRRNDFMIGENIKKYRKKTKLSQRDFAKLLNVANGTISMWENNLRAPDLETIKKISALFNIPTSDLVDDEKPNLIPVLGRIPAGIPIAMIEDILDYEEINPEMLAGGKEYFALKVKGDSMLPDFKNGDVLIVRKQDDCENGAYAIIAVNGDDATFKKVIKKENGIILQPLNTNYEPLIFDKKQIETLPVKILGVVVEIRRSI